MAKKKILILGMACNQEFFIREEVMVRKACYAKDVLDSRYPGIDFWTYTSSSDDKYHVNRNIHKLSVPADDTLYGTFEKTQKAFRFFLEQDFDFDYIFRTNLSTHVNPLSLSKFTDGIPESEAGKIFSSKIYFGKDVSGPEEYSCYAVGNSMLIPRIRVEEIAYANIENLKLRNKSKTDSNEHIYRIDDNAIGLVCNCAAIERGESMFSMWKQFGSPVDFSEKHMKTQKVIYYITIPFRDYYNEDRHFEFILGPELRKNALKFENYMSVIPSEFFYKIRSNNHICIVDFNKHQSLFCYIDDAVYFSEHPDIFSNNLTKFFDYLKTKYNL
jgi:hypothetical protein